MAWLLIDNSNARTKLALGDADGLAEWRAVIPTAGIDVATLDAVLTGVQFGGVCVASVVPDKAEIISGFFRGRKAVHFLGSDSPLGFGFELEFPGQVGSDRLANVVALKEKHGIPGIAVDFGTAVTFSVLSAEGNFQGGAIAPGMGLMTSYLAANTARLSDIQPSEPDCAIGKTTLDAMRSGAVHGHRGMVAGILREIVSVMGTRPHIVATGGGAGFAAAGIPGIGTVDPDLTLDGIRVVAARVFG